MEDKKKEVVLDREIHLGMLLRFALPTILSIVMPLVFISTGIGTMFGSGGNALVARKLLTVKRAGDL